MITSWYHREKSNFKIVTNTSEANEFLQDKHINCIKIIIQMQTNSTCKQCNDKQEILQMEEKNSKMLIKLRRLSSLNSKVYLNHVYSLAVTWLEPQDQYL